MKRATRSMRRKLSLTCVGTSFQSSVSGMGKSRREFLATSVATLSQAAMFPGFVSLASGCGSGSNLDPSLRALAASLEGDLLVPSDSGFAQASEIFNGALAPVQPLAVAMVASAEDVSKSILYARDQGVGITARGGGHSYAGYSVNAGLVVSMANLKSITVNASTQTATVGAGALLIDLYSGLNDEGYLIPGGTCPTVGVSGFALGGGYGLSGRNFGLICDNLISATIVTADGEIRTVSEGNEGDLFWALRGGGGGNFGYVTEFEFRIFPTSDVSRFELSFPWSNAAELFDAWQTLLADAPNELTTRCLLTNEGTGGDPSASGIQTIGQYFGSLDDLRDLLAPLYAAGGTPTSELVEQTSFIDSVFQFAGCSNLTECQPQPVGDVGQGYFYIKSAYASQPYPEAALQTLVEWTNRWPGATNGAAVTEFDGYGGVINETAPTDTAFVHRNELFLAQFQGYWDADASDDTIAAATDWLNGFAEAMAAYGSGAAYQNYIDPDLENWEQAYYGENLSRLIEVKRQYDPSDLFRFAQSLPTSQP